MIDQRVVLPAAGLGAALLAAMMFFSMAGTVQVPPAPDSLYARIVRLDTSERTMQRFERLAGPEVTRQHVTLLTSEDFPGVTFRPMGAARHVSIPVPATLELHMTRDPAEAAETHRQFPNITAQIDVFGLRSGSTVLADPEPSYRAAADRLGRYTFFGQASLLAAAICALLAFRGLHRLWRQVAE